MSLDNLPVFYDMPYTDKDGNLTSEANLYNDQMFQTLNNAVFLINTLVTSVVINDGTVNNNTVVNNGLLAPQKTTAQITALEPTAANGTIWFNTTLAKLQVKTASGIVQTITSV